MLKQIYNKNEVLNLLPPFQARLENKPRFIDDFSRQTADIFYTVHDVERDFDTHDATWEMFREKKGELDAKYDEIVRLIEETRKYIDAELKRQCREESGRTDS